MSRQRFGDLSSMVRGSGFGMPAPGGEQPSSLLLARVAIAPGTAASQMVVVAEGQPGLAPIIVPAGQWASRDGALPVVGALCLVVMDDLGDAWVPMWAGADRIGPQPGDLVWSMASTRMGAYPADGTAYTLSVHPELLNLAAACPAWVSAGVLTMPSVAGRTVVGSGTGAGLTARSLGQTFGEETHLLAVAEMPSHTHPQTQSTSSGGGSELSGVSATGSGSAANNGNTGSTGGGGAHNNMQPSIVLNPFILI